MPFEEPSFVEINMDAEVGSYQSDFGDLPLAESEDSRADDDVLPHAS